MENNLKNVMVRLPETDTASKPAGITWRQVILLGLKTLLSYPTTKIKDMIVDNQRRRYEKK